MVVCPGGMKLSNDFGVVGLLELLSVSGKKVILGVRGVRAISGVVGSV